MPTPSAILKMRGSRRADQGGAEPALPVRMPDCPHWLSADARLEWERLSPLLLEMGIISEADRAALAMCCQAWSDFVKASKEMERDGRTPEMRGHARRDLNAAVERFLKLAGQFGLTPSARARINTYKPPAAEDDEMERLINGEA